ncbi:MAG: M48 family metallopeptidase [Schwartzia sp.]|nr:M48 family metallopeptidase [Schwartzia sp. (in: firmicutes)]MBR1885261.1 M48 family metallopeptidase [Schwartzia sp. (in: firmicutes)]
MEWKKLRKKVAAAFLAGSIAFSVVPAPTAHADLLGTVIGAGIQYAAMNKQLSYYDNEGRDELFQKMQQEYGVNEDPYLNERLDHIMASLSASIARVDPSIEEKPYQYFINNDTSFNAFCTLGHNISVNTGMFDMVANDDEIAVVLGHEMGHGQKNHVQNGMKDALLAQVGAAVLTNGSALGSVIAGLVGQVHMPRAKEREADKLAFQYLTHSDFNPGACAAIWQRVMERSPGGGSSFLSDHPDHKDRRDTYAKSLTEYSDGKVKIDADAALVKVNGKDFVTPAPADDMSSHERAYFVMGNLATAYHNGHSSGNAWADGSVLMLGNQPIMECVEGDPSAPDLANRLNAIK